MSNVDWDSKVVIGNRAKAPKVTRNARDLNGSFHLEYNFYCPLITYLPLFTAVRVFLIYLVFHCELASHDNL